MTMTHVVYDITGCPGLDQLSGDELIDAMRQTAHRLGCTPRTSLIDPFEPFGHTCVLVLSESHITVSTWPESGLAHVDVFTCRAHVEPGEAIGPLLRLLGGQIANTQQVPRLPPDNALHAPPPAKKGFCSKAGPITCSLLPSPEGVERIATNPCLAVNGFLGLVLDAIPEHEMADKVELRNFRTGLRTFAEQVVLVADAVDCAYENDHLAVSVYQDPEYDWSLGVVAVVRGDVEALAEDAICLLAKQVPFIPDFGVRAEGPPTPKFCADSVLREAQGYQFRVVWLGSSDKMCRSLSGSLEDA